MHNALGLCFSHLSGTMQAHSEGLPTLAYQIGLNARAAVTCAYMAAENLIGPKDFLEGDYGYFNVIEGEHQSKHFSQLGRIWRITELSHKPFPSGRASHGAVDAVLQLMKVHQLQANQIKHITLYVPPLVKRLVDRPYQVTMSTSYAKLCMSYLMATALENGALTLDDFSPELYAKTERIALAAKVSLIANELNDPNALSPLTLNLELTHGKRIQQSVNTVLGSPDNPLNLEQQLEKFHRCCLGARKPLSASRIDELVTNILNLEQLTTVDNLISLLSNSKETATL